MTIYTKQLRIRACIITLLTLGQARTICEDKRTLLYTVEESANSQTPSAVHTVKNAEVVELTPITRLLSTAESEIVGSPIKAFYICDLCMFTVDLTSLIGKYFEHFNQRRYF